MLTPARFLLSKSAALAHYHTVRAIADAVSYSVKTNPLIAPILEQHTDSFFTIHFIHSLRHINDKSRVWFIGQGLSREELDILFGQGVRSFVIDNEGDMNTLLNYLNDQDVTVNLLLRLRLKENTVKTGKYFVYGMHAAQINRLIPELRQNKRLATLGIHFHRKTENLSEWSLREELSQTLPKETLEAIDILNIGGGLPVQYKNFPHDLTPGIFKKIGELRDWLHCNHIQLIIEPGRFIAGPSIRLEAQVINAYDSVLIINCSVYNAAMDTFVADIRLMVKGEQEEGAPGTVPYLIKGCTPDSMDIFRYRVFLPKKERGDTIIFRNAGAYTYATDFCGLEKLKTVVVD